MTREKADEAALGQDRQALCKVAYRNARENTPHTARLAHDQALSKVMQTLLTDDTQVYKQFVENEAFRRQVSDMVYGLTQLARAASA